MIFNAKAAGYPGVPDERMFLISGSSTAPAPLISATHPPVSGR